MEYMLSWTLIANLGKLVDFNSKAKSKSAYSRHFIKSVKRKTQGTVCG